MCFITIGTYAVDHSHKTNCNGRKKKVAGGNTGNLFSRQKILVELVKSLIEKKAEAEQTIRELKEETKKLKRNKHGY